MRPSLPCAKCGHVDDLETVNPLGIQMDTAVLWNCRCGNTRAVVIDYLVPQELVRKAMVVDEMRNRMNGPALYGKPGRIAAERITSQPRR